MGRGRRWLNVVKESGVDSRERVRTAIEHREPDRVPADLGGSIMTGIMAQPLVRLRQHLGLADRPVKVYELFQMLGEVELDVVETLGIDVLPVEPPKLFFEITRENYKPWTLFDGTEVVVPGQFEVEVDGEGNWLLHEGGRAGKPVVARMPRDGFYFDWTEDLSVHPDYEPPALAEMEKKYKQPLPAEHLDFLARRAEQLRPTGKALFLGDWLNFGPPHVGNWVDWLCVLASDADYVERLFEISLEAQLRRLEALHEAVEENIDVFGVDATDYGTQRAEMFRPELFERCYLPFYRAMNEWVHENTTWKTWAHSCGSMARIMPMLAESGLDCISPVQCSAAGMEPEGLKEKYGDRLTFWGGAVDTQQTLPFGTAEEVYEQAAERIKVFGPGGGFVFNPVHNVQANTPPENIAAMFQALRDYGEYPIQAG